MSVFIVRDVCVSDLHSKSGSIFVQFNVDDKVKRRTSKSRVGSDHTTWSEIVSLPVIEPETSKLSVSIYGRRWYITYRKLRYARDACFTDILQSRQRISLPLFNEESQKSGTLKFAIEIITPTTPTTPTLNATRAHEGTSRKEQPSSDSEDPSRLPVQSSASSNGSRSTLEPSGLGSSDGHCRITSTSLTKTEPQHAHVGLGAEAGTKHHRATPPPLRVHTSSVSAG
ncbi:hypothetical protein BS17DRAFT_878150 [Gyrodon lividus]|nr:hypothetical protein BS17DRAFT_878150 [Gyrodon lividus]